MLQYFFTGELPTNILQDKVSTSLQRCYGKLSELHIATYFFHSGELDNLARDVRGQGKGQAEHLCAQYFFPMGEMDHFFKQPTARVCITNRVVEILIMRMLTMQTGGTFIGLSKWTSKAIKEVTILRLYK